MTSTARKAVGMLLTAHLVEKLWRIWEQGSKKPQYQKLQPSWNWVCSQNGEWATYTHAAWKTGGKVNMKMS